MVRDQHLNTRIRPEAYKALLVKCADEGCSTYTYVRNLIHSHIEEIAAEADEAAQETVDDPAQKKIPELLEENERSEGRITISD